MGPGGVPDTVTRRFDRLLHLGSVVIDVVLDVPALPSRGGDVLASATQVTPGGGFNVMVAARAQGLPVGYAGAYGTGPFASLALAALTEARLEVLQPPKAGLDTGFVVTVVDAGGERTFLTSRGAEATLRPADLAGVRAGPRDAVYLSGYGLLDPGARPAILGWLDRLGEPNVVFFDPGPLVGTMPADALDRVLGRADWVTCNAREAAAITGRDDPLAAARALASPEGHGLRGGVLVRTGPAGCVVGLASSPAPVPVPGFLVDAVDTNGAGDAHTGTFVAALARGADALAAARTANAAAALSVTRRGPATAPSAAELARFLAGR